jgi:hypothetical protein
MYLGYVSPFFNASRGYAQRIHVPFHILFSGFLREPKNEYNRGVDVLIIPEARREIDTLIALRPRPGTWGVVVGHKRGSRFIVEKIVSGGSPGTVPDDRTLAELERIWPGRFVGIAAVRPGGTFKKALLGPAWYAKLVLQLSGTARTPVLRSHTVEFKRKFVLEPVPFAPAVKE